MTWLLERDGRGRVCRMVFAPDIKPALALEQLAEVVLRAVRMLEADPCPSFDSLAAAVLLRGSLVCEDKQTTGGSSSKNDKQPPEEG